nr:DUF2752 domain-containing protein [uncultured Duncaniella sp.]
MKYWIIVNDTRLGPMDLEQLIATPGFGPESPVWREGLPDWVSARNLPELADRFTQPAQHAYNQFRQQQQYSATAHIRSGDASTGTTGTYAVHLSGMGHPLHHMLLHPDWRHSHNIRLPGKPAIHTRRHIWVAQSFRKGSTVDDNIFRCRIDLDPILHYMVAPDNVRNRILLVLAITAALAAGTAYYLIEPSSGLYPRCMFHQLTGLYCPGCGSQRAIHAMLHGNWSQAWSYNAILPFEIVFIAIIAVAWRLRDRYPRLHGILNSRIVIISFLITIIGWTIIRNIQF